MSVSFVAPLERAWERTRGVLFSPFRVETWIVVGFAAFLARLFEGGAGLGLGPRGLRVDIGDDGWHVGNAVRDALGSIWLLGLPLLAAWLVLAVALLWVSSRGHFLFLDNMLAGRGAIVDPWKRYGRLGDSLFLWRLALAAVGLVAFGAAFSPWLALAALPWESGGLLGSVAVFGSTLLAIVLGVVLGLVSLLLESFVVPLMYRDGISTNEAWRQLLPLLRRFPFEFLLYALFLLLIWLGVMASVIVVGCAACCIPFFLLSVPYVNTLLLLPFLALVRLYAVEFLAQFGPEFTVTAPSPPEAGPAQAPAAPHDWSPPAPPERRTDDGPEPG